jgi:(2Fe-2S) ferredoxin
MRFQRHIFICVNQRDADDPRGCCGAKGGEEVRQRFKAALKARGLKRTMRANTAGCLDACQFGVSAVVYPDCVWYGGLTVDDVDEIIDSHLLNDIPVERLLIRDPRYTQIDLSPSSPDSSDERSSGGVQ